MTKIIPEQDRFIQSRATPAREPTGKLCCPDCFQRIASGDAAAFALLYHQYREQVYEYTLLLKADGQYCDDIVQEIFSRIWLKKEQLGNLVDFKAWLFIVTRNFIINWNQKKIREQLNLQQYGNYYQQHLLRQGIVPRENEYEALLAAAVQQLAPQQKLVYQLQKEYSWHRREIAKAMHLSPETIKTHSKIAMKVVRKYCLQHRPPLIG